MLSLLIFIIEIWFFTILALSLHYLSPRIGLAPILFLVGGIIGLLNIIEINSLKIAISDVLIFDNIVLRPGGHILVPTALLIILLFYVANGTRTAQIGVMGVVGVAILVFIVLIFLSLYNTFQSDGTVVSGTFADTAQFNLAFIRALIASLIAFVADMYVIIIVYQGINNAFPKLPNWIAPSVALILALWTDTVLFNILAFVGTYGFALNVSDDVLMKTVAGLLISPFAGYYLTIIAPTLPQFVGPDKRPIFDILFRNGYSQSQLAIIENELQVSRAIYQQLTQHIEEVFWLFDSEKEEFLYVSPAYERITQRSIQSLYQDATSLLDIVHPDDKTVTKETFGAFFTREFDIEFRIVLPSSAIRWVRMRSFPINDDYGNTLRFAGVAEDITERQKLTEQAFSLQIAKEKMQILNDFVRDASHDLKTPLSAMTVKIGLLNRIEDEERRRTIRGELQERAMHLSELIDDLFTLSRIEGHEIVELDSVDMNALINKVCENTQPLVDAKNLDLKTEFMTDSLTIQGNSEQLERLVSNLLSNAIRYTHEGSITVKTWRDDSNLCFSVTDTGIGIGAENHEKIFERFYRSDKVRDTQEGTGLGLAICKAIVERHNGKITVTSIVDEGSTFLVQLPKQQSLSIPKVDIRRTTQEIRGLNLD